MQVSAFYFDGRTSRRHEVTLQLVGTDVVLTGEIERRYPLKTADLSEASMGATRRMRFPDGACLEILDNAGFGRMLEGGGHQDSALVRIYQSWRATALALAAAVALLFAVHRFGVPVLSAQLAQAVPATLEQRVGRDTLAMLDSGPFSPSELPAGRQAEIVRRFRSLSLPSGNDMAARIIFRNSRAGPNAFALPAGQIVVTDQLVAGLESDDELMAVIAHELGHLAERHLLQRLIHTTLTGAAMTLLFGDVSALAANLPTVLLDLRHSRDNELAADDYALRVLRLNGMSPAALASALHRLHALQMTKDQGPSMPDYLSTHPGLAMRIARLPPH